MKKKKSSQKHAVAESDLMHTFTASRERDQKKNHNQELAATTVVSVPWRFKVIYVRNR